MITDSSLPSASPISHAPDRLTLDLPVDMTAGQRGESVARWLEGLADHCEYYGEHKPLDRHYYRGIAILYRARATDVRAALDIPSPDRNINTGEIIL